MSPHETLFLESTQNVDISLIANNNFVRFQTWDFGGDLNLKSDVVYMGKKIPIDKVFQNCSTLVYVIDAQEEDFEDALPKLVETISAAHRINPLIHFEVFLVSQTPWKIQEILSFCVLLLMMCLVLFLLLFLFVSLICVLFILSRHS